MRLVHNDAIAAEDIADQLSDKRDLMNATQRYVDVEIAAGGFARKNAHRGDFIGAGNKKERPDGEIRALEELLH